MSLYNRHPANGIYSVSDIIYITSIAGEYADKNIEDNNNKKLTKKTYRCIINVGLSL